MVKRNYRTTTVNITQYKLAEKLAERENRSVKNYLEVLIDREAEKIGVIQ